VSSKIKTPSPVSISLTVFLITFPAYYFNGNIIRVRNINSLISFSALASDDAPLTLAQWQRTAQNPLSPNFSLPLEYKFHGNAPAGNVHMGSFGAIMPAKFDGWNLINQLTLNLMGTPGDITGIKGIPQPYVAIGDDDHGGSAGYAAGLSDAFFTTYISPSINDEISLGLGAAIVFPTDEPSRELGSGKFSMGPPLCLYTKPLKAGLSAYRLNRYGLSLVVRAEIM
jgi:hypothetical protein